MSIPLITNFNINTNSPIDSRMVVTNSTVRDAIAYKYDGMQVFTTDTRIMWTYATSSGSWTNSNTDGNGIYSGSGYLPSTIYINTGTVSNTVGTTSYNFVLGASAGSSGGSVYYSTIFNRQATTGDYSGIEARTQWSYNSNTSSNVYISYNPYDSINDSSGIGGLEFGTSNTKRVTIDKNGLFRLWSPTYSSTIIPSVINSYTYSLPNKSGVFAVTYDPNGTMSIGTMSVHSIIVATMSVGTMSISITNQDLTTDSSGTVKAKSPTKYTITISGSGPYSATYDGSNGTCQYISLIHPIDLGFTNLKVGTWYDFYIQGGNSIAPSGSIKYIGGVGTTWTDLAGSSLNFCRIQNYGTFGSPLYFIKDVSVGLA